MSKYAENIDNKNCRYTKLDHTSVAPDQFPTSGICLARAGSLAVLSVTRGLPGEHVGYQGSSLTWGKMCSGLLESRFHRERMYDILFDTQQEAGNNQDPSAGQSVSYNNVIKRQFVLLSVPLTATIWCP